MSFRAPTLREEIVSSKSRMKDIGKFYMNQTTQLTDMVQFAERSLEGSHAAEKS